MAEEHHPLKPFYSVLVLAFGCSLLVALAAVGLKPLQDANKSIDQKRNILRAAGLYKEGISIEDQFSVIDSRIVELNSGEFIAADRIDPKSYNQRAAAISDESGRELESSEDIAGIRRLENYSLVYLVKNGETLDQLVVPVRGKGLWSTMYAYVALDSDLTTIRGISFYEHGETPGLGGEIANPRWQNGWKDKRVYSENGEISLAVTKNIDQASADQQPYLVDALSGATLTSDGVENLIHFWFGENGFQPFFERIRREGGFNG